MSKKTKKKNIEKGLAFINSTHNNTIITFTDLQGNTIAWSSSGAIGYKGTKKGTPFAASLAAKAATENAIEHGVKTVEVKLKNTGPGKESALKQISASGIEVTKVIDVTSIPFNGTRPPRKVYKRATARK